MSHPLHNSTQQHFLIAVVTVLAMLGPFSVDTYLPAFPDMEAAYGITTAAMSQTLGVFLLGFSVSTLAWGPLIDRFGRKSTSLASLLGFAIASGGCALSTDYATFFFFRGMEGLFASCGLIAGRAMIRDVYAGSEAVKAMSKVMFLFAAAPAIAPIVGAWLLDAWGWQSIFWFLVLLSLLLALCILFFIKETQAPEHVQSLHPIQVVRTYARTLTSFRFILLLMCLSITFAGMFLYIAGASPIIYNFLGLTGHHFSILFVPMVLGMMVGSWLAGKMSTSHTPVVTVSWGFVVLIIAALFNILQALYLPPTPLTVIGPLTIYAFGISLLMPSISVMVIDCFPRNRGVASSMQGFFYMGCNALVASMLLPLVLDHLLWFALSQATVLGIGLLLWGLVFFTSPCPIELEETISPG